MSTPAVEPEVPGLVTRLASGRSLTAVWANEIGGTTWRIGAAERAAEFVKVGPLHPEFDPGLEASKLRWVRPFIAVPEVLGAGVDGGLGWLHTRALADRNTIDPLFRADPGPVIDALGIGLRRLHDAAPVADCPWRRELAPTARGELGTPPPVDRLVVCHGDPCAPNTIVDETGEFVGLVDLGELGVGDRWSDLGAAHWSLEHNFGPGWWARFLAAYGIADDPVRRDFHRRVWEFG